MPQPFKGRRLDSSLDAIMDRPELAAHVAYIAAIWSRIDITIGLLFSTIAGIEYRLGIDIYLALKSTRMDALMAIAETRIDDVRFAQLEILKKEIRDRAGERNTIVHGIWSSSVDEPEGLIHSGESENIELYAHMFRPDELIDENDFEALPRPRYMVYKRGDFEAIEERLLKLFEEINDFRMHVSILRQIHGAQK